MTMRSIGISGAIALAAWGCDSIPFIGGGGDADTAQAGEQVAAQPDTAAPAADTAAAAAAGQARPAPRTTAPQRRAPVVIDQQPSRAPVVVGQARADEPWAPTDTGAVNPGMTRAEVVAVWGEPVAERAVGAWTYLYFRNGCEVTCGTFDVVMLQGDQVMDAIVRGPGHTYTGVSSSPPGREALPNLPGGAQGMAD